MARTREEIAAILATKKQKDFYSQSVWADLVRAVQAASAQDRQAIIQHLRQGDSKRAGLILVNLLRADANQRAADYVANVLIDDSLSLTELDSFL